MTQATLALTGARVFDGTKFLPRADVVFAGNEVLAVGMGAAAAHPEASVIDATGKTIIPGLIDLHIHALIQNAGGLSAMAEPFSMQFYDSVRYLRRTLEAGITSARDAGGADLGTRVALERGVVSGPRLRIAIQLMSQTGGHGDHWLPSGGESYLMHPHAGRPSGIADGPDEVRKVVRTILRAGADQIKICSTGGVLSPSDDPRHSQFMRDEIRVIVEEAEAQGTYVMAHAQGTAGIQNALVSGVRSIEHGIYLDDSTIQMFLDNDAYLVPTLVAPLAVLKTADAPGSTMPQVLVDKARRVLDDHRASIAAAIEAGVKIGMGTDSGVGVHGENLEELVQMADLGMSLDGVLHASTSVAGELINGVRVGRLEPGYLADAVVLDGELTSTSQLASLKQSIRQVYQDGKLVHEVAE